ncbi:hypothetical protein [Pedobacter psychroterrae]|uniref:Uncharacterized protein n=1 Tax=Pedobacter psychroterrae TaxID=2530453 RepID=A0A4R0N9R5_9SPHI|nr:hypothetical protein [Pedobacter psychroterrae]TCC96825.1 hypothetical protein EZ437_20790 [Pedobacter psychroterrae]
MKLFIQKILLLCLILLVILCYPLYILYKAGEFVDPDTIINRQRKEHNLFHQAYTDESGYIKLRNVRLRKPEVLVLGSSRVMGFRSFFFKNESSFYNASRGAQSTKGLNDFLDSIPDVSPKILMVSLDQFWFNERSKSSAFPMSLKRHYSLTSTFLSSFERVCFDILRGKASFNKINASNDNIGLFAIMRDEGFRYDGSFKYNKGSRQEADSLQIFKENYNSIEEDANHYEHGAVLSKEDLRELTIFLERCKKRNIHVVAFLPPYAPFIWDKLLENKSKYQYMFELQKTLPVLFAKYDHKFFDFSDITKIGGNNQEAFDGLHLSENANLRMMIEMCKQDTTLNGHCNLEHLTGLLRNADSPRNILKDGR